MGFKANVVRKKYGVTVILKDQSPRTLSVTAESRDAARLYIRFMEATDPEYEGCRILEITEADSHG